MRVKLLEALGGKGPIVSAEEGGSDAAEEKKAKAELQPVWILQKSRKRKDTKKAYVQNRQHVPS